MEFQVYHYIRQQHEIALGAYSYLHIEKDSIPCNSFAQLFLVTLELELL